MSLYTDLIAAGVPVDNHESDLYCLASDEARRLIVAHNMRGTSFLSAFDGRVWFDVPFAYDPWWEARTVTLEGCATGAAD